MPEFTCDLSAARLALSAFLGAHRGQRACAPSTAGGLAAADAALPRRTGFRYVRFHALLSDELGTLVCEVERLLYSFSMPTGFSIFCFPSECGLLWNYLSCRKRLASGPTTVFNYRANVTPPKDYPQWSEAHSKTGDTLGGTLWRGGSPRMVL